MKIGIYVKKPESIFSNGCIQQTFFLKKLFDNIGYQTDFLSIEKTYTHFDLTNDPIIFTNENFDYSSYTCVMLGSLVLLPETNQSIIDNLKKHNTNVINLICGNVFVLHQEEFVFDVHNIISHYKQDYFTENWVLEMYDYAKDYIQMLSNKPTHIMPYVWDIDIIKNYVDKFNILKEHTPSNNEKVNLLIFEPNMSIHKNALVPLVIANQYYRMNKHKVNKVYMFCGDKITDSNRKSNQYLAKFEIVQDKKLETYGRIIMPYIIDVITKNNNFVNVVLSYNILNNLNFIHLEMFYLGIPIIHNCEPFKDNGLFFDNFDLTTAVNLIDTVRTSFDKTKYISQCKPIIEHFSPNNASRQHHYKCILDTFVSKIEESNNTVSPKNENACPNEMYSDPHMFYQGTGYVLFCNQETNIASINRILRHISDEKEKAYVELFFVALSCPIQLHDIVFDELIDISILYETEKMTKANCIKLSSFATVHFININSFTSMNDVETYTK